MPSPTHPLLARLEQALERPFTHLLLLVVWALAFHGHSLSFGLIYDDHVLLGADHWRWFTSPWEYGSYYRPLQALVFTPRLVSAVPVLLHLENLVAGALIVFLLGRLLLSLGLSTGLVTWVEAVGIVLPTSMPLFVWISQRADWLPCALGLALASLTVKDRAGPAAYLGAFLLLGACALLAKESGIAVILLAPALLVVRRRRILAAAAAFLGLALCVGYLALRAKVVPGGDHLLQDPAALLGALVVGLIEVFLYSWLPVCFTANWLYLGLGLVYGAGALLGFAAMWRRERPAALALGTLFVVFAVGTALHPVPRNLALPGMVTGAFACYGGARLLALDGGRGGSMVQVLLLAASLCSLANLSLFDSYALQDWVEPINEALESSGYDSGRGLMHPIDMNTPFQLIGVPRGGGSSSGREP